MKYGIMTLLATLLMISSCRQSTSERSAQKDSDIQEKNEVRDVNIVKKHISIPFDFSYITNLGSVDIIYTQGNYSIDVEGDSAMLKYLNAEFDSNVLTVSVLTDNYTDINIYGGISNIKMYVSAPNLKCVSICGNGGFESQATWHVGDLQLGVLGSGSMKIGKVECTTFDLQSTGVGNINITDLQADDATIYSRSSATINANVDVNNLIVINDGTQNLKLTGKASNVVIKNPNDARLVNELK